jgi:FtsH-binding integral membrane protein
MSKFSTLSTGAFDRYGRSSISLNAFYALIAVGLAWGFGLTAICANYAIKIGFAPNLASVLLVGLVIPIIGIVMACTSSNAIVSFIGYNFIVVPLGLLLGPVLKEYSPEVVKNAMEITCGCTILMGVIGVLFPNFFSKLGSVLFIALISLLVIRILQIFLPLDFAWIDYLAALLFCLYIGYDMYRANTIQRTVSNAIDICVDFYLDIINLFLNILKIVGKK